MVSIRKFTEGFVHGIEMETPTRIERISKSTSHHMAESGLGNYLIHIEGYSKTQQKDYADVVAFETRKQRDAAFAQWMKAAKAGI
jgi:type IV secretory pathway component VirB8